jgi:hypothetical protein
MQTSEVLETSEVFTPIVGRYPFVYYNSANILCDSVLNRLGGTRFSSWQKC